MTRLNPRPNRSPGRPHPRLRAFLARTPGPALIAVAVAFTLALARGLGAFVALSQSPTPTPTPTPAPATSPSPGATSNNNPTSPHRVVIRNPIRQPRVETGAVDSRGQPITVACGACHATSAPRPDTRLGTDLDEFHQGLQYQHGSLTCLSCHDASNYDQLRMADGRGLPFPDAMTLCAQCHGPQFRDYSRGSHGGMTGHWDLSKGPRSRNHCVDCHDPHAPQYPIVQPAFPLPPDRGLPKPHVHPTPTPHHG